MSELELFKGITKSHVLKAIETIYIEGYSPIRRSTTYDLVQNEVTYPPKYVLSLAGYFKNGTFIDHDLFSGGEESTAFAFLRSLGFTVLPKSETTHYSKAKEIKDIHKKYLLNQELPMKQPPFFTSEDLTRLEKFASKKLDRTLPEMEETYQFLKKTYEKVDYWGRQIMERLFKDGAMHIIRKPINQANKFETYLWAKIYPTKELKEWKILAYTVTLSKDREDFCIKIDTVGGLNENSPVRRKYLDYRGEFFNSPIVKSLKKEEVLASNWESLIEKSIQIIKSLEKDYQKLLSVLGYNSIQPTTTVTFDNELSLNTIYYGPPGTGKTFELNEIKNNLFTDVSVPRSQEDFLRDFLKDYSFWQVIGAALYASKEPLSVTELIQNPLVRAKVNPSINTKPRNLAWRSLQSYADEESSELIEKYRRPIKLFHKDKSSRWSIVKDKLDDLPDIIDQSLLDIAKAPGNRKPPLNSASVKRYNFITFHQKYSYEDFIEGIKPLLKKEADESISSEKGEAGQLSFELKKGIFYNCCLEALKLVEYSSFDECFNDTKDNRTEKFRAVEGNATKQYALFIDEINRANISAVFGELITLIEETKRIGQPEEMWIELPYSNEPFAVPPNLYLIGSMNTADRSIALLDIALRRRFDFIALYPNYKTIPEWADMLKKINDTIFELKKNPDFFIGHAFFINSDPEYSADLFNKKIIPLLMEYFQNNASIVKKILDAADIKLEELSIINNYQLVAKD